MAVANDIVFLYSGGTSNFNPKKSLGGLKSVYEIPPVLDNLFSDASEKETQTGITEYRCIYVQNNSETIPYYSIELYFDDSKSTPNNLSLGLNFSNDTQNLVISGNVVSGYFTLGIYGETTYNIDYNSAPSVFAENIQFALNDALGAGSIGVSVLINGTTGSIGGSVLSNATNYLSFSITFFGKFSKKSQPLLIVVTNNLILSNSSAPIISISKMYYGTPINNDAEQIGNSLSKPPNINFYNPTLDNKRLVGDLLPGEYFPVWIKRTIKAGVGPLPLAGATLQAFAVSDGKPIPTPSPSPSPTPSPSPSPSTTSTTTPAPIPGDANFVLGVPKIANQYSSSDWYFYKSADGINWIDTGVKATKELFWLKGISKWIFYDNNPNTGSKYSLADSQFNNVESNISTSTYTPFLYNPIFYNLAGTDSSQFYSFISYNPAGQLEYLLNIKQTTNGKDWKSVYENKALTKKQIIKIYFMNGKALFIEEGYIKESRPYIFYLSSNGCKTWQTSKFSNLPAPISSYQDPFKIDYIGYFSGNYFFIVNPNPLNTESWTGDERNGSIWKSSDFITWTKIYTPTSTQEYTSFIFGTEAFGILWFYMLYGTSSVTKEVLYTSDLTTFNLITWGGKNGDIQYSPEINKFIEITYENGVYNLGTSSDAIAWSYTPLLGLPVTSMTSKMISTTRDVNIPYWRSF